VRLSTNAGRDGTEAFNLWWYLSRLGTIRVWLDGVEQQQVTMADDADGVVWRCKTNERGECPYAEMDEIAEERLTGLVEISVAYYRNGPAADVRSPLVPREYDYARDGDHGRGRQGDPVPGHPKG
jgi:hypothetical protein